MHASNCFIFSILYKKKKKKKNKLGELLLLSLKTFQRRVELNKMPDCHFQSLNGHNITFLRTWVLIFDVLYDFK